MQGKCTAINTSEAAEPAFLELREECLYSKTHVLFSSVVVVGK